jgi:hypothetical protein
MTNSRIKVVLMLLIAVTLVTAVYLVVVNGGNTPPTSPKPIDLMTPISRTPVQLSGYWIKVDPISDKEVGDIFTINARTNIPVGDEVLVQVYSNTFTDHRLNKTGMEFKGAVGTVRVARGNGDINITSFVVNTSAFTPDEYLVTEEGTIQDASGAYVFNISLKKTLEEKITL